MIYVTSLSQKFLSPDPIGQWRTQDFFSGGGVQQIQLRTEERTGIWGAVAH